MSLGWYATLFFFLNDLEDENESACAGFFPESFITALGRNSNILHPDFHCSLLLNICRFKLSRDDVN